MYAVSLPHVPECIFFAKFFTYNKYTDEYVNLYKRKWRAEHASVEFRPIILFSQDIDRAEMGNDTMEMFYSKYISCVMGFYDIKLTKMCFGLISMFDAYANAYPDCKYLTINGNITTAVKGHWYMHLWLAIEHLVQYTFPPLNGSSVWVYALEKDDATYPDTYRIKFVIA